MYSFVKSQKLKKENDTSLQGLYSQFAFLLLYYFPPIINKDIFFFCV